MFDFAYSFSSSSNSLLIRLRAILRCDQERIGMTRPRDRLIAREKERERVQSQFGAREREKYTER